MQPEEPNPFSRWSREELQEAEAAAGRFLEENSALIAETLRVKARFLEMLIQKLGCREAALDQRLECFARISELAGLLRDEADGFFRLASQPVVARILSAVEPQQ